MRIAVMGGGAMGGAFGARLAEAGNDVLLVDVAPSVVASVEEHGLHSSSRARNAPSSWT